MGVIVESSNGNLDMEVVAASPAWPAASGLQWPASNPAGADTIDPMSDEHAAAMVPSPRPSDLGERAGSEPSGLQVPPPHLSGAAAAAAAPNEPCVETSLEYHTVLPHEAAFLRVVLTPAIGSCLYSCIVLAKASTDFVYEWHCTTRLSNGVARDPERAAAEKDMAQKIASKYETDVDAERIPMPAEYEPIACALGVTLDVHFLYAGELVHFYINRGSDVTVRLFLSGSGGSTLRDCTGHFDFIFMEQPQLGETDGANAHGGWGM